MAGAAKFLAPMFGDGDGFATNGRGVGPPDGSLGAAEGPGLVGPLKLVGPVFAMSGRGAATPGRFDCVLPMLSAGLPAGPRLTPTPAFCGLLLKSNVEAGTPFGRIRGGAGGRLSDATAPLAPAGADVLTAARSALVRSFAKSCVCRICKV